MRSLSAVLIALAFALAACGGDDDGGGGGDSDEDKIRSAIATFADSGEEACDVITDEYIEQLFGGRDQCLEEAGEGESADVEVDNVQIDGTTATADGTAEGETATLTLEKVGEEWKISGIEGP
jgi:hypothetical protein